VSVSLPKRPLSTALLDRIQVIIAELRRLVSGQWSYIAAVSGRRRLVDMQSDVGYWRWVNVFLDRLTDLMAAIQSPLRSSAFVFSCSAAISDRRLVYAADALRTGST